MDFSALEHYAGGLVNHSASEELLRTNEITQRFGLSLTPEDAAVLLEVRSAALKTNRRIEVGSGIVRRILLAFCSSDYISQQDYVPTVSKLIDAFYYLKNESLDLIPDEELICIMADCFEKRCHGSAELLIGRELESLARFLRFGGRYEDWGGAGQPQEDDDDE